MDFEKNFCSSPWFHMRINNSGTYEYCRWREHPANTRIDLAHNIRSETPLEFFQNSMSSVRQTLLAGNSPKGCSECSKVDSYNKVSGRQRQLLKAGIQQQNFAKTLASSPMRPAFEYSDANQGHTDRTVMDWQIDLGNYCNSACVFCNPEFSSRLAVEFKSLGLISQLPPAAWCEDPVLLNKFISDLLKFDQLHYLHFIGGETLITPGFVKILQALIDADLNNSVTIGFTTNLTVWSEDVNTLLSQFKQVNLGMSVETLNNVNDYVRWPAKHAHVQMILDQWRELATQHGWLTQLRITPTCLTINDLTTVYDYAWQHEIAVESCNFLEEPKFMRIGVLPTQYIDQAKHCLAHWLTQHRVTNSDRIINARDPNVARLQIVQDVQSYINYLDAVDNESYRMPDLIVYLKKLESSRHNCVLDYLPQYDYIFRSAGY